MRNGFFVDKLWKVLKNIENGFWTIDNSALLENGALLAGMNPWKYVSGAGGGTTAVETKRLTKDNTDDNTIQNNRKILIEAIQKA